jgi:hypothetical protein
MVCSTSLVIGLALFGASVSVMLSTRSAALKSEFAESLTPDQLEIYESIIEHRLALYFQGLVLGIITALIYMNSIDVESYRPMHLGTFAILVLGVQYLYYMIAPKNEWMLDHISTPEQARKWLDIYQYMSKMWHLGFLMAVLGAVVGCHAYLRR